MSDLMLPPSQDTRMMTQVLCIESRTVRGDVYLETACQPIILEILRTKYLTRPTSSYCRTQLGAVPELHNLGVRRLGGKPPQPQHEYSPVCEGTSLRRIGTTYYYTGPGTKERQTHPQTVDTSAGHRHNKCLNLCGEQKRRLRCDRSRLSPPASSPRHT